MPAPKNPVKTKEFVIVLPVELRDRMEQHLFDDEKGRVPKGAISSYISNLIRRDLLVNPIMNNSVDLSELFEGVKDE